MTGLARAALLPEDVLADILARLPPRGLAAARAVCTEWRAAVDGRRLLRADLPLSVGGIFVSFNEHRFPEYLSRPSAAGRPTVSGLMDYLPSASEYRTYMLGHCNGLLLVEIGGEEHVVNPATRRWAPVPPAPPPSDAAAAAASQAHICYWTFLVFDPTLSPDYEVVSVPYFTSVYEREIPPAIGNSGWPPPACSMLVFSSRTGRWEETLFVREGEAVATVFDVAIHNEEFSAAYWQGALYVNLMTSFTLRISLSDHKYRATKPPVTVQPDKYEGLRLGKSKKGIYLASLHSSPLHPHRVLRVWMLDESCGQMEWSLRHNCDLGYVMNQNGSLETSEPWILQDINFNFYRDHFPNNKKEAPMEEKYEWDSDNDSIVNNGDRGDKHDCCHFSVIGFHPFKVVFLMMQSMDRGLAYHLDSSKVQDLGNLYPTEYEYFTETMWAGVDDSFPYTPCWM